MKAQVNPKSTSNQSSKPCTVLQYPSKKEWVISHRWQECVAVCCSVLQCVAVWCSVMQCVSYHIDDKNVETTEYVKHTSTHWNTLQHTAMRCNTLQHTSNSVTHVKESCHMCDKKVETTEGVHDIAAHCSTLQHTATHCNTLQHTATHCNTL